jgi:hypothetical protein
MTPSNPPQDLATQWKSACRLAPLYLELAREFVIDVKPCEGLEPEAETPAAELVEQARQWLEDMDKRVQVHQLRQFLQTSALVEADVPLNLLRHFLAKSSKDESDRDKIDFLLVQYLSQLAPARLDDNDANLDYVANELKPVLGEVELKTPVWLNALDRVLEAARRCRSLDELLHGGVLAQGRKAKAQAGDLFYLPIALVAFTRFGYLMRRVFFRLMHGDLNAILDGLNELEAKGVNNIDCRRAQFSADEPISRLRMICQSWKVMFQAEYSSGQPLRMLVDLRASVDQALGHNTTTASAAKPSTSVTKPGAAKSPLVAAGSQPAGKTVAAKAAAVSAAGHKSKEAPNAANDAPPASAAPEFEVSGAPHWDPDSGSHGGGK